MRKRIFDPDMSALLLPGANPRAAAAPAFWQNEMPLKKGTNSSTSSHPSGRPGKAQGEAQSHRRIPLHLAHDVKGAPQQVRGRLRSAEGGVGRQRDVVELRERMVGLDGLGMEYIEPGAADAARRQCVDQRRLVDE